MSSWQTNLTVKCFSSSLGIFFVLKSFWVVLHGIVYLLQCISCRHDTFGFVFQNLVHPPLHFIEVIRLFAFNMICNMVEFKFTNLLFVFNFCHLAFVIPLFFPAILWVEYILWYPFYVFCHLCAVLFQWTFKIYYRHIQPIPFCLQDSYYTVFPFFPSQP